LLLRIAAIGIVAVLLLFPRAQTFWTLLPMVLIIHARPAHAQCESRKIKNRKRELPAVSEVYRADLLAQPIPSSHGQAQLLR